MLFLELFGSLSPPAKQTIYSLVIAETESFFISSYCSLIDKIKQTMKS